MSVGIRKLTLISTTKMSGTVRIINIQILILVTSLMHIIAMGYVEVILIRQLTTTAKDLV